MSNEHSSILTNFFLFFKYDINHKIGNSELVRISATILSMINSNRSFKEIGIDDINMRILTEKFKDVGSK